ncbi:MAG: SDR family NAD(P)-dependent oxidoreductase [Acidobacteriaceae bacterium]
MNSTRIIAGLTAAVGVGCLGIYAARRMKACNRPASDPNPGKKVPPLHNARKHFPSIDFRGFRRRYNVSLAGKVVLIAGGSRGLGLALAEEFASRRARVILTARDPNELERARKKLVALGIDEDDVEAIPSDLTDDEQARNMISRATRKFGQIDILVNSVGIITVGPVENQPLDAFKKAIESNYYTMLHSSLAVMPQMLARGSGIIVNIASVGAKVAVPHLLPYSASKFAALGFSQGLHAELRAKGVRVLTVCPGLMRTGSHTHALFTGNQEREYRWFSLAARMPLVSISARAAAKKIVRATAEGRAEIAITPQAILAATFAQAVPESTAAIMHWVNSRILPAPIEASKASMAPGKNVRGKELTPWMTLGRKAARQYNEN